MAEVGFFQKVYACVRKIPKGKVATYGQIARMCGQPRASRAVGYALHANPDPSSIPCYRVVNREGRLSPSYVFGGQNVQKNLLESDGIIVYESDDGFLYIDINKYITIDFY